MKIIGENTAKFAGGTYLHNRFYDIVNPPIQTMQSGDEIAADIISRAGLEVKNELI